MSKRKRGFVPSVTRKADLELEQTDVLSKLLYIASRDMNSDELAKKIGVAPSSVSRFKRADGLNNANFSTVRRIAHIVGCTKEEWLKIGGF